MLLQCLKVALMPYHFLLFSFPLHHPNKNLILLCTCLPQVEKYESLLLQNQNLARVRKGGYVYVSPGCSKDSIKIAEIVRRTPWHCQMSWRVKLGFLLIKNLRGVIFTLNHVFSIIYLLFVASFSLEGVVLG